MRELAKKLFRQCKPEERYPLFQILLWMKIREDVKEELRRQCENAALRNIPDYGDFDAMDTADYLVYLSMMDPRKTYRENLKKGILETNRNKPLVSEARDRIGWLFHEESGKLFDLLNRVPETAEKMKEKLKKGRERSKKQLPDEELVEALCRKDLIPPKLRDTLLSYLAQPMIERDLQNELITRKQNEDLPFLSRAVSFYLWDQEFNWDKPYYDQLLEVLERVKNEPEKDRYQMITIPIDGRKEIVFLCQILSSEEDFSLSEALMETAKAYEGTYPDFFQKLPEALCREHGFYCVWNQIVEKNESIRLGNMKPESPRIKRSTVYERIKRYVFAQMKGKASERDIWEEIYSLRNAVTTACYFDAKNTVLEFSFRMTVEEYRKIHHEEDWAPMEEV